MKINVLLTCVGGEFGPQMLMNLKNSKKHIISVIGVDNDPRAIGKDFCDFFFIVPRGDDKGYVDTILKIVSEHSVDLVMPTSDEEAVALSERKNDITSLGAELACIDYETLKKLTDKSKTYQALKENNIHTPKWDMVACEQDLNVCLSEHLALGKDLVVKPVKERGGRGVHIISNNIKRRVFSANRREILCNLEDFNENLKESLSKSYPLIVMERLKEPVYDLDLLAWKGEAIRVIPRRRVNSAVPNDGHIIVNEKKLIELGDKIIKAFNLSWLYDCDVMFDENGNPCVLEINPRQSGSVAVSIAAGIPFFDDLISLYNGEEVDMDITIPFDKKLIPYKSLHLK